MGIDYTYNKIPAYRCYRERCSIITLLCLAKNKMFDPTQYGIPEDKFKYIVRMIEDEGVTILTQKMASNPNLDIYGCQQEEFLQVDWINNTVRAKNINKIIPRKMTQDMHQHVGIVLTAKNKSRKIMLSNLKKVYDDNGELIPNPNVDMEDGIPKDFRGIYFLFKLLHHIVTCSLAPLVSNDIYKWAEKQHCIHMLEIKNSYLYDAFDFQKDFVQSLIDIFGFEVIKGAVDYFSDNGSCDKDSGVE